MRKARRAPAGRWGRGRGYAAGFDCSHSTAVAERLRHAFNQREFNQREAEEDQKTGRPATMLNAVFTGVTTEPASPAASGPRVYPAGFMSRRGRPGEAPGRGTRPATTPPRPRRRGRRTRRDMTKSYQGNRYRRRSSRGNQPAGQRRGQADAEPPGQGNRPDYSPQQREQVRDGLRILARLIARAHLRRQKGCPRPE